MLYYCVFTLTLSFLNALSTFIYIMKYMAIEYIIIKDVCVIIYLFINKFAVFVYM